MTLEIVRELPDGRIEVSCGCMFETVMLRGEPTFLVHACRPFPVCEFRQYVEAESRRQGHRIEHRSTL